MNRSPVHHIAARFAVAFAATAFAVGVQASDAHHTVVLAESIQWGPAPPSLPPGAQGIGAWSDAEIKRAITQGISRDGRKLQAPMGYSFYARMTQADLDALVAYLRTVPPQE